MKKLLARIDAAETIAIAAGAFLNSRSGANESALLIALEEWAQAKADASRQ